MGLPKELEDVYARQHYSIVGDHSAVKTCHWVRRSLNTGGREYCYKQRFYGVPCHRCLQMTPSLGHCTQSCVFCWRITPEIIGVEWDQNRAIEDPADPEWIVDECLDAHRQALSGFGGNPNVTDSILQEAMHPVHAAISLEGEPTLYPYLGDLVECFKREGFQSTFIVSNGTNPDLLKNLSVEPSQLYISVCAPNKEIYHDTCRPLISDGWEKLLDTLELLNSFTCPTVLRHTLVPKLNMRNPKGYAKLAELANATYIEPKAAMSVGYARERFSYKEMAWHEDIRTFAERLSMESGYNILDEDPKSSIVLLSRLERPINLYKK